ncbi:hypothetical protein GJ496_001378 [Pomphorhynchus laevis]|nr:hypothetical protein GJ496_001378 [Pomphorhynchus laevis]
MIYFIYIILLNHALSLDLSERCIKRFDFVTFTGLQHFKSNDGCYRTLSSNRQTFVDHTIPDINIIDSEIILSHNAIENISFVNSSRFWNLNYFAIDHNHLSAFEIQKYQMRPIDIILANNNQIRIVSLDNTIITSLNRTECIGLRVKLLDLSWNFISSIEYYNCKFNHLKLHHNLFKNDDILNIEDFHVERLDLSFNYISKLNFKTPNIFIRHLTISSNQIDTVRGEIATTLIFLKSIDLSHNKIAYFENSVFSEAGLLLEINLSNNNIYHLARYSFSSMNSLKIIDLSNNLLRNVSEAFYKLDLIESINLQGNPFTSQDFHPKPIAQLKELYLENLDRPLEYLNYGELVQLQILYIKNASNLSDSKELTHLNSTLLELTVIQPDNSKKLFAIIVTTRWIKLKKLHLQNFELYSLTCSLADQVPELRVLSLIESDIHFIKSSLDIIPSTLEILNLSGNPLKYLDLTNIRNFYNLRIIDISDVISFDSGTTEYLNISNTSIPSVLIKNLTNLVVLCLNSKCMRIDCLQFKAKLTNTFTLNPYDADCPADILQIMQFSSTHMSSSHNVIKQCHLMLPCLTKLVIEQYEETSKGYHIFFSLIRIRWISIKNGMITNNRIIHFRFLNKLQILHLQNITSVYSDIFGFVPYLQRIKIIECSLINDSIDLSNKGHLHEIILHKTAVNFQPEKFCSGNILLETLNISAGGIRNLPSTLFKHCSQLTSLILSYNEIRQVDNQFEEFYNNNLQLLDLSNNFIFAIDLNFAAKCILLRNLDLSNNRISYLILVYSYSFSPNIAISIDFSENNSLYAACYVVDNGETLVVRKYRFEECKSMNYSLPVTSIRIKGNKCDGVDQELCVIRY